MLQLIHIGNNKLNNYKSFVKLAKETIDKSYASSNEGSFQSISLDEVQGIDCNLIREELKKQVEEYALNYLTIEEGKDPVVYLSALGDVRIVRQLAGNSKDRSELGFESTSNNTNSAITTIWHLNTVEGGELEFEFQEIKISPSNKEVIIFPSYFTHAHRFNPSSEDKLFLITTFYIGG